MNKNLIFYDIMGYNYPYDKEYFFINSHLSDNIKYEIPKSKTLSSHTQKQEQILNKYGFLYKMIPFVDSIYICNSLSFKSIHQDSDIDLFIVTKKDRIFLAKLFLWIFLKMFRMYGTHQKNKFCLGFYVTKNNQDLYPISIFPVDIYLAYRITHLQPLYSEDGTFDIYKQNIWVKEIIPNYSLTYKKILKNKIFTGKSLLKRFLEKLFGWDILNKGLGIVWKKKMSIGKKKLGKKGENIILSDNILKFQAPDIRNNVYLKYKLLKGTENKTNFKKKIENTLF